MAQEFEKQETVLHNKLAAREADVAETMQRMEDCQVRETEKKTDLQDLMYSKQQVRKSNLLVRAPRSQGCP